jgi:hypothetical protein
VAVSLLLLLTAIVAIATAYSRRDRGAPASAAGSTTSTVAGSPTAGAGRTPSVSPRPSATRPAASRTPASTAKPAAPPGVRTKKKGVSAWYFDGFTHALADVKASWYYNWASGRGNLTAPSGVEFVPMIWGADSVKQSTLDEAKRQGKVLLGFNEPDLDGQADMMVEKALDLWPQLQNTGMRLGSPAPAFGAADAGSWFDRFMSGAKDRGYRIDFIALHWYGSDFSAAATGQLRSYLQATYNRYHKPIWLTEYALINFSGSSKYPTQAQQAAFVRASTDMLEGLPFVERYAWFALPATDGSGTGLYRDGDSPTTVGVAYRAAG